MALQERNQDNGYRAVAIITAKVNDTYGNSDEDFFSVYYNWDIKQEASKEDIYEIRNNQYN